MSTQNIWTEEEINFLREHNDMPFHEIAKILNRTPASVATKNDQYKIKRASKRPKKVPMTVSEKQFLIDNYQNLTVDEMAERLGKTRNTIFHYAKKLNLKKEKKDYLSYFKRDCSSEYAYILGWLFADGCIRTQRGVLMTLQEQDALFLKPAMLSFYDWSISPFTVKAYPNNKYLSFRCNSRVVARFLADEWSLHKKSHFMSDNLYDFLSTEEYKRCFLRGFFEGDGSVHPRETQASIAARIDFDWTNILRLLPPNIDPKIKFRNTKNNSISLLHIGERGPLFYQYIYGSQYKTALPRKKDKAISLLKNRKRNLCFVNQCDFF